MKKLYILGLSFAFLIGIAQAQPGNALDYAGGSGAPGTEATGDYVTLPTGVVSTLTGSYTIEAWVFWRGGPAFQRIFDFGMSTAPGGPTGTWMFLTPSTGSVMRFAITTTGFGAPQVLDATVPLPTNSWTHVALVFQSGTNTASIYINGTLNNSGPITIQPSAMGATDQNWLGQSQFHPSAFADPYFDGIIDEFRISNVARYTSNFTPNPVQFTVDGNTVALYHFNESSGQTVTDETGTYTGFLGSTAAADGNDPARITNSILPVTIEHFVAQKQQSKVELKWRVATTGGGSIIVERSNDGRNFQQIGAVTLPEQAGTYSYQFTDQLPGRNKNYYRLKIVEDNASPKYSTIVLADMGSRKIFSAYPTLATARLFVNVPDATQIAIYNSQGVMVKKLLVDQPRYIDISSLGKGVYHIQFEGSDETIRFVKM